MPHVHDLVTPFLASWDAAGGASPDERVARFRADVVPAFPAFYEYRFAAWHARGLNPDEELAKEMQRTAAGVAALRAVAARLPGALERALASFRAALPDLRADVEAYVLHSLGECDGGVRMLGGRPTFLVGADVIARLHEGIDDVPFLHHELFHLYHLQYFEAGREPGFPQQVIHTSLWGEGLAIHAASVLNPEARPSDLLLDVPPGAWEACQARRGELAGRLLADLRSEDAAVYSRWFLAGDATPGMPRRAGYGLGYLAVRRVAKGRTLAELARLRASQFLPLLESALQEIRDDVGADVGAR